MVGGEIRPPQLKYDVTELELERLDRAAEETKVAFHATRYLRVVLKEALFLSKFHGNRTSSSEQSVTVIVIIKNIKIRQTAYESPVAWTRTFIFIVSSIVNSLLQCSKLQK